MTETWMPTNKNYQVIYIEKRSDKVETWVIVFFNLLKTWNNFCIASQVEYNINISNTVMII